MVFVLLSKEGIAYMIKFDLHIHSYASNYKEGKNIVKKLNRIADSDGDEYLIGTETE